VKQQYRQILQKKRKKKCSSSSVTFVHIELAYTV
jgi:hypothetical protein